MSTKNHHYSYLLEIGLEASNQFQNKFVMLLVESRVILVTKAVMSMGRN